MWKSLGCTIFWQQFCGFVLENEGSDSQSVQLSVWGLRVTHNAAAIHFPLLPGISGPPFLFDVDKNPTHVYVVPQHQSLKIFLSTLSRFFIVAAEIHWIFSVAPLSASICRSKDRGGHLMQKYLSDLSGSFSVFLNSCFLWYCSFHLLLAQG